MIQLLIAKQLKTRNWTGMLKEPKYYFYDGSYVNGDFSAKLDKERISFLFNVF